MNTSSVSEILDFEVHLLMTMKIRMVNKNAKLLENKLAEHGLSVADAQRIHERVSEALGDEASRFENMKKLLGLGGQSSKSLEYSSVLWPGFDFTATASEEGVLESARYWHTRSDSSRVDSPTELPPWSMDIDEFTKQFGPLTGGLKWTLFDKLLPSHEEYEFPWNGERHGAAFSWGLFMFASKYWPED
ncbi:hypothetical protein A4G26_27875 [Mycobacterium kansasii]|uniref:Uncharacterized protein n=1 Tax=Mycobacterium innocens TaxID=2341083 RepID=A0A498PVY2_9MYCO|nr:MULTISPECIES: hypothetical protein [Mycobacterium]KZS64626.1 hypothetical protein A4G26_27875 [Mycobacterium kansasii]VBA36413.1 hypothetical protein LAUMK13_01137 [Mycobacterium innocens]